MVQLHTRFASWLFRQLCQYTIYLYIRHVILLEQVSRAYLFAICIIHLPHFDIQWDLYCNYIVYISLSLLSSHRLICSAVCRVLSLVFSSFDYAINYKAFLCLPEFGLPKNWLWSFCTYFHSQIDYNSTSVYNEFYGITVKYASTYNRYIIIFVIYLFFGCFLFCFVLSWVEFQLVVLRVRAPENLF